MFAEGHRAQACLLLAIFFAIAAGVVSSIRMTQASPAGKK
jgi:DHA2 family multidrug resistance protein-like MFS transporter